MNKKVEVKSKNKEGQDVTIFVVAPGDKALREAQKVANKTFGEAIKSGAVLRSKLDSYMREQGLWDDVKQKELDEVQNRIAESIKKLTDKNSKITLQQGKDIAVKIRLDRIAQTRLINIRSGLDEYTVEGQSENAKFEMLMVQCVLNENGEQIFKDIDDYRDRSDEPFVIAAAGKLSNMVYGIDTDWEHKLPENKFLKQFGFADGELRLINDKGQYITSDGKLVDKDGRFIDEGGNFIDSNGNKVDSDGFLVTDFSHFEKPKEDIEVE